jgi:UDP-MurNAc hydroxylase
MKITHLSSATEIIEVNGLRILTDPWLDDGTYYGSWFLYPPYQLGSKILEDIDYIYISHIHPDHFCEETMAKLNKSIPVLIHNFKDKFLKRKIESTGFKVMELDNNQRTLLKNGVYINIFAADNCNPEICGKAFGCFGNGGKMGEINQIDSMCVIDNEKYVLLNTNDCPFPIAYEALGKINERYPKIDFLLVGYASASLYPYAVSNYSESQMREAQQRTQAKSISLGAKIVAAVKPKFYMPFAGTYVLGGLNWELNTYSPIPELHDVPSRFSEQLGIQDRLITPVLLNSGESFNLETETQSNPYSPINISEKWEYIKKELSAKKHPFEFDPEVSLDDFLSIIPEAYKRFCEKRKKIGFESETTILISLPENKLLKVPCIDNASGIEIADSVPKEFIEPYIYFQVDFRLLMRSFKGPRYAHWNNIEVGALLKMERQPDKYEMGIHIALCSLHV